MINFMNCNLLYIILTFALNDNLQQCYTVWIQGPKRLRNKWLLLANFKQSWLNYEAASQVTRDTFEPILYSFESVIQTTIHNHLYLCGVCKGSPHWCYYSAWIIDVASTCCGRLFASYVNYIKFRIWYCWIARSTYQFWDKLEHIKWQSLFSYHPRRWAWIQINVATSATHTSLQ